MEIAGTVVGIVSLGIQATQSLVQYYTSAKDQKDDISRTIKGLNRLLSVLEVLHTGIKAPNSNHDGQNIVQVIESSVQDCEEYIHELADEAKRFADVPVKDIETLARTAVRRVTYPFCKSTLQKLQEAIDGTCSSLNLVLNVLQQKSIANVQEDVEDTKKVLDALMACQMSADIQNWLRAPDTSLEYNEACKKRYQNTGNWFVKGAAFSSWLVKPNSFLWLNGFAGCGKSVLSSTAIQHALKHRHSNSSIGLAYFYFTFNDEPKQSTSSMLRSLILQLGSQLSLDNPALDLLGRLRKAHKHASPPDRVLLDALRILIKEFSDVYLILDALDESPKQTYRGVTSRDEQDIRESLLPGDHEDVKMKNHSIDSDIESFIAGYLQSHRRFRRLANFHHAIQEVLASKAEGSFRWVECQFIALETCPGSKSRVNTLLASLPRTLHETYERMLLNIDEDLADDARRALTLLCTATRPLTAAELIDAMAVELGELPMFNRDKILSGADDILHICPGLLEVDQATIRIAHNSVREYLESERISQSQASKFHVQSPTAHTEATRICLTYMIDPQLCSIILSEQGRTILSCWSEYPFLDYALTSWEIHHEAADKTSADLHSTFLLFFNGRDGKSSPCLLLRNSIGKLGQFSYRSLVTLESIYAASCFGMELVVTDLLHKPGVNRSSEVLQGAWFQAVANDHLAVLSELLRYGCDVDVRSLYGTTGLIAAMAKSDERLARLVLEAGSDPNQPICYCTLRYPSGPGKSQWFLEEDFHSITPLTLAAWVTKHEALVKILLDFGADPHLGHALEVAAFNGQTAAVSLLLEHGVKPNQRSLMCAVGAKCEAVSWQQAMPHRQRSQASRWDDIISSLLDKIVNADGDYQQTVLEAAITQLFRDVVRILLDPEKQEMLPGWSQGRVRKLMAYSLLINQSIYASAPYSGDGPTGVLKGLDDSSRLWIRRKLSRPLSIMEVVKILIRRGISLSSERLAGATQRLEHVAATRVDTFSHEHTPVNEMRYGAAVENRPESLGRVLRASRTVVIKILERLGANDMVPYAESLGAFSSQCLAKAQDLASNIDDEVLMSAAG
ncbi:ankyrin repeat, PH and SEC7 domain-containing protein secG [Triangularia verruculosa]|uniref:Ankyrin repeat, PH and SEC7 domain-containing protein secG n=1 Tax=Triangularia verruculosa TaxID=2587418 RepID=A0AAN7AR26_9PEZI|nr:ankyrin repeat, PH and SEC7 domain-containing protein secG [Triangularia verruculosa]